MSLIATAVKHLLAAGVTGDALVAAIADMEANAPAPTVVEAGPSKAALRQRRYAERQKASANVITDASDAQMTGNVTAASPSLPPLLPPQTPPTTPPSLPHEYITTHAKSRILWIVAAGIEAMCRASAPKPTAKRKWPRAMPPPPQVSDEQWAGFVAHRISLRKPLTDRAYDMLVAKLAAEATDEWPPGRIVDEMVERVWLSFKTEWLRNSTETRNESVRSNRGSASRAGDGFANALHEASGYHQADFRH